MKRLILSMLTIAVMASCSKQETADDHSTVIKLWAAVDNPTLSKAPIDVWGDTEVAFAKGVASGIYAEGWNATIATGGAVTLTPEHNYDITETYYLRGYAPRGAFNSGVVTFNAMNGTQDILISNEKSGSLVSEFSGDFTFGHLLTQLNFAVKCNASFGTGNRVTAIAINGTALPVSLDVPTGVITYAWAATPIAATFSPIEITETASTTTFGAVMIEPGKAVTLDITTNEKTYTGVPVTIKGGGNPQAGSAYTITIAFNGNVNISLTATLASWAPSEGSAEVK